MEQIRKQHLDLHSRLHSIDHDAKFVRSVHEEYPDLPVVKNLRCGAWYTDPEVSSSESAYFKSTDGHYGCWSFNLRRPNLHILKLASQSKGIVLVDSTRAGKRVPDALSKTLPIWCSVLNRAIIRRYKAQMSENGPWIALHTPPGAVSKQEHAQIEKELDRWVDALLESAYELPDLDLPLRPFWVTPSTSVFPTLPKSCIPIVCVSASAVIDDAQLRRTHGFVYVQGSGDDHELWGQGLNPDMFWEHKNILMTACRDDLPDVVASIAAKSALRRLDTSPVVRFSKVAGRLAYVPGASQQDPSDDCEALVCISCLNAMSSGSTTDSEPALAMLVPDERKSDSPFNACLPPGKKGYKALLDTVLPSALRFIEVQLSLGKSVCVATDETDVAVAVLVSALQLFFTPNGELSLISQDCVHLKDEAPDKQSLRMRLHWIISDCPGINPSRAILKRVNGYILSSNDRLARTLK